MSDWQNRMLALQERAYLANMATADLRFDSGHQIEVIIALTEQERVRGLSLVDKVDMGMLFCYGSPTYVPFTMKETAVDLEIAHYNNFGELIQRGVYKANSEAHVTCPLPFSFVLETQPGQLPDGNFKII